MTLRQEKAGLDQFLEEIGRYETALQTLSEKEAAMDDALAAYTEARSVEERLSGRAQELRRRFNDEQAGVLASSLRDGEPCPVCGALTRPTHRTRKQ